MMLEYVDVTTKTHKDFVIYAYENKEAVKFQYVSIEMRPLMGVFYDKDNKIIGVNTFDTMDIYSPKKIRDIINSSNPKTVRSQTEEEMSEYWINWWNNECKPTLEAEEDTYEEVELKFNQLSDYFIETVENTEDTSQTWWYTYYLKPATGLSVKVDGIEVDYTSQSIEKIQICESETGIYPTTNKRIYFYDKNDKWVEDIDITTKKDWDDISFVFVKEDLTHSNTRNKEQQLYVDLYEKLNPYNSVEENKEIITKWLKEWETVNNDDI